MDIPWNPMRSFAGPVLSICAARCHVANLHATVPCDQQHACELPHTPCCAAAHTCTSFLGSAGALCPECGRACMASVSAQAVCVPRSCAQQVMNPSHLTTLTTRSACLGLQCGASPPVAPPKLRERTLGGNANAASAQARTSASSCRLDLGASGAAQSWVNGEAISRSLELGRSRRMRMPPRHARAGVPAALGALHTCSLGPAGAWVPSAAVARRATPKAALAAAAFA